MNFFLVGSCLLLFCMNLIAAREDTKTPTNQNSGAIKLTTSFKETEKLSYPKKVNLIKKTQAKANRKKIADITDKFRDLPDDDLAFIKELDKQFKLHGGKIKIKVENKNVSETKNSKRTIDGELGYGYAHNGYHYDPPKFMFYPYSQQNIESNAPAYFPLGDGKTEVSIEPSYSYELKPQTYVAHNEQQTEPQLPHAPAELQQHFEEPVIVLRIPGPAKYASHLQMLLQKYLEIRAAQYLHILEEAEHGNLQQQHHLQQLEYGQEHIGQYEDQQQPIQQHHQHHHLQQQQQHVQQQQHHDYDTQQVDYEQQNAGSPHAEHEYPAIDQVYHTYKHRHSGQQVHSHAAEQEPESYYANQPSSEEQHQYNPPDHYHYQQPIQQHPQFYYAHQQEYAQPEGPPANSYHQVLLVAMPHPQQVQHDQEEEKPQPHIYVQEQKESALTVPIAENNPRPSHTKVVFTNKNEHATHDYQMYQLPSIKPNERHAPTSTPDFHQDFHRQQETSKNYQQEYQQYTAPVETTDKAAHVPQVVAITQRPYNYHAHSVKGRARGRTSHSRRAVTPKEADQGFEKIREFVRDKLGGESGSAVEFKTTQFIDE